MDKVLAPHKKYCGSHIEAVAIFSKTWTEHLQHVIKVFEILREIGQTLNLKKCELKKKVKFLDYLIGFGQNSPDPEKFEGL